MRKKDKMGIRSDVVVALKMNVMNALTQDMQKWLKEDCDEVHWGCDLPLRFDPKDDGVAFMWDQIKWYTDDDPDLIKLYAALHDLEMYDDFVVLVACSEYPGDHDGDMGSWYNNPWEFHKRTVCEIGGVLKEGVE
jgi:hypothetical protein